MPKNFADRAVNQAAKLFQRMRDQMEKLKAEERILRETEKKLAADVAAAEKQVEQKRATIDISTYSVAKATLAVAGIAALAYFLLTIKDVLITFFLAGFLALAFDPFVDYLQRYRVPRGVGILLIYAAFITFFTIIITSFIPILTTEIPNLMNQTLGWLQDSTGMDTTIFQEQVAELEAYLADLQANLNQESIKAGLDMLGAIGSNTVAIISSVAGGVVKFGLILVITFFMTIEEDGIKKFLMALFPSRFHGYIHQKSTLVEEKFGGWVRGQLLLMLIMGVLTTVAMWIVGVKYAVTLGALAAFAELIPYVGPIIALVPALIIGLTTGGFVKAAIVLIVFLALQQLEGNVFVPLVMKKSVGLSPVVIMFAMLVGASFPETVNPIVGIILSVPVATAVSVFVNDYADRKK